LIEITYNGSNVLMKSVFGVWGHMPPNHDHAHNNIKMDLQELGCGGMDWIELAQDRDSWRALVNAVMNFRVS
jgi:hypothetical protein